MRFLQSALLVVITMFAGPAFAQATADVALEVTVSPAGPLVPGSTAQVTLTFRNHGPAQATFVSGISSGYPFLIGGYFDLFAAPPNACLVQYDDFVGPPGVPGESFLVAIVTAGTIPAGGTRVCTLSLLVYPESRGPFELSFRLGAFTPDPNPANNEVVLGLVFAEPPPRVIPATDATSLVLLALGFLLTAVVVRRR